MPLNPLDWTGGYFLILFAALISVSFLIAFYLRFNIGSNIAINQKLSPFEIAFLSGGEKRAQETILLKVLASDAAKLSDDGKALSRINTSRFSSDIAGLLYNFRGTAMSKEAFYAEFDGGLEHIKRSLVQKGLLPSSDDMTQYKSIVALVFCLPLMLGGLKIFVGLELHKPVEILTLLMIGSVIGVFALFTTPYSTQSRRETLFKNSTLHSRAMRAPVGSELVLAFALAGPVVLQGTAYAAIVPKPQGDGGSSADGGSGCGSGCGGCGS